jgi:hypothetical protein
VINLASISVWAFTPLDGDFFTSSSYRANQTIFCAAKLLQASEASLPGGRQIGMARSYRYLGDSISERWAAFSEWRATSPINQFKWCAIEMRISKPFATSQTDSHQQRHSRRSAHVRRELQRHGRAGPERLKPAACDRVTFPPAHGDPDRCVRLSGASVLVKLIVERSSSIQRRTASARSRH